MEGDQGQQGGQDTDDHHGHLQRAGGVGVAGVDGGRQAQSGRGRAGQVGEHPDDLRAEVVAAALTAQRRAGLVAVRSLGEADEFAGHLVRAGGDHQSLAFRAEHTADRRHHHRGVAHHDHQVFIDALDQQSAIDGLGRLLGHGGQQHRCSGGVESARRAARHGDRQIGCHVTDQRRGHAAQRAVLRPVQLRGGLLDGQERCEDRTRDADEARRRSDHTGGSIVRPRRRHGARC